jgi:hypothetical protein
MKKALLFIFCFFSLFLSVTAIVYTDSCATINDGYLGGDRIVHLNASINGTSVCFEIDTSNVVLNCDGYYINDTAISLRVSGTYDNITVNNCIFYADVYFGSSTLTNSIFSNLTFINGDFEADFFTTFINSTFDEIYFYDATFDYESGASNYNSGNTVSNLFFYGAGYFDISKTYNTTFSDIHFFSGNYGLGIGRETQNNLFTNMTFNNTVFDDIYFYDHTISPTNNIFYNNVFYSTPNITSSNWSLTPNSFNLSGQGNTYYGLTGGGVICFDDPLNQTCDSFASPFVVSVPSTTSSLFPFSGFFSLFIIFFGLVLFLR